MRNVVCSLVALMFAAHVAAAQQVRGRVVDSATASPISGAVASLLDSAGRALARTITDQQGRFRLSLATGATRLQLLRIGFRPRDVRLQRSGGDIDVDTYMTPVPRFLESVRVSDREVCPGATGGANALALWEQARAGLLATIVARDARPARVQSLIYERRIDMPGWKIVSQIVNRHGGLSSRPFVASRPAAAFGAEGFMVEYGDDRHYFAPDADVLLDPAFAATHCFRVQFDESGHPAQVGLGFQPAPGRDMLVDVSGVLWLDRNVPALRTLEFRFTGLEPAGTAAAAGGSLLFREMPHGVVFIERWKILMPLFTALRTAGYSPPPTRRRTDRRDVVVNDMIEGGGELVSAAWADARWDATLGRLGGVVVERGNGKPVPNVRVWLEGTGDSTTTDSTGAFLITGLLPGPYKLRAADTTLAEFGFSQSRETGVDVARELPTAVTVRWDSLRDLIARQCRGQDMPVATIPIFGRAYLPSGKPATNGVVGAKWKNFLSVTEMGVLFRDMDRKSAIDDGGRFQLCGVPRDRLVRIRALSGDALMKDTTVALSLDATFGLLTVTLQPLPARP